jgi:hypothetical protein
MTYGITTTVKPLTLSKKQITKYLDKIEHNWIVEAENANKEQETITTICNLLQLLDVDKVMVTESGSKLDCHLKIDVAVKKGDHYIGFQVKSSKCGYDRYISNYLTKNLDYGNYNGQAPGCVWLNKDTDKLRLLVAISKWLDITINAETEQALLKYKQCKFHNIKPEALKRIIDNRTINLWVMLGIAKYDNGMIGYLR